VDEEGEMGMVFAAEAEVAEGDGVRGWDWVAGQNFQPSHGVVPSPQSRRGRFCRRRRASTGWLSCISAVAGLGLGWGWAFRMFMTDKLRSSLAVFAIHILADRAKHRLCNDRWRRIVFIVFFNSQSYNPLNISHPPTIL
jgi:hypothetical protein